MKHLFQIGIIITMSVAITACGKQVQAETTAVTPTTIEETTAEPSTEESSIEESTVEESSTEEVAKIDLPTLSTGKTFDEISAMQYEIVYNSWSTTSDEEKVALGREGLKDLLGSLVDFTEEEKGEIVDYILSKSPIPEVETKSSQSSQPAQSNPNETKVVPKETQASVQPTTPQPQETEPISYEWEPSEEEKQRDAEREAQIEAWEAENGPMTNEAGEGHGGTLSPEEEADWDNFHIGG